MQTTSCKHSWAEMAGIKQCYNAGNGKSRIIDVVKNLKKSCLDIDSRSRSRYLQPLDTNLKRLRFRPK